jgi:hypothetical protein
MIIYYTYLYRDIDGKEIYVGKGKPWTAARREAQNNKNKRTPL